MEFFNQAIDILKILVMALGAGLAVWGVINLLEGYGSDNPAANAHVRSCVFLIGERSHSRTPPSVCLVTHWMNASLGTTILLPTFSTGKSGSCISS